MTPSELAEIKEKWKDAPNWAPFDSWHTATEADKDIAALVEEIEKLKIENLRMGAITGSTNLYLEELKLENQKYKAALEKIVESNEHYAFALRDMAQEALK